MAVPVHSRLYALERHEALRHLSVLVDIRAEHVATRADVRDMILRDTAADLHAMHAVVRLHGLGGGDDVLGCRALCRTYETPNERG